MEKSRGELESVGFLGCRDGLLIRLVIQAAFYGLVSGLPSLRRVLIEWGGGEVLGLKRLRWHIAHNSKI